MPKTVLSPQRLTKIKKQYLGKIIIFCEGYTERNYMQYFANIINSADNKFTDIHIELELAGGNAQTVLNHANEFFLKECNNRRYTLYKKYLVFDCDDPKNIQSVIIDACSCDKEYELLVSNFLFETWLLMHYENIGEGLTKIKTYRKLEEHLGLEVKEYSKKKNSKGIIRKILSSGEVEAAISIARQLDINYKDEGLTIYSSIKKMNPYSNIFTLIEQFMIEISE